MANVVHAFEYLAAPTDYPALGLNVLVGDERFLKQMSLEALRAGFTDADGDEPPFASFDGEEAAWRDVADELATVSLFGASRRLAVVRAADDFVKKYRSQLEQYAEAARATAALVLEVASMPSNTRLYKAAAKTGLVVDCRPPTVARGQRSVLDQSKTLKWLEAWAETRHQVRLQTKALQLLLDLTGPEFGLMDQSLAKIALLADGKKKISAEQVMEIVGGWKTQTTWELADAAADGNAAEALSQLDHLLHSGELPIALFGQIAWSLRRYATAARIYSEGQRTGRPVPLRNALLTAGFRSWPQDALQRAEAQLRQLGRHRADKLYRWLLDADLALKGSHSTPARGRLVLEQLLVRLADQPHSRPAAGR